MAEASEAKRRPRTRGKGEGSVFQRSGGGWVARAEGPIRSDGKRQRLERRARTRAEALRKLGEMQRQLETGVVPDLQQNVGDYLKAWMRDVAPLRVRASTLDQYRYVVDGHLVPRIGREKLGTLTTGRVQRMVGEMVSEGLAPLTVRQVVGVLSGALGHAVRSDMLPRNPCQYVELPRVSKKTTDDTLSTDEVRQVVEACAGTRWEAFAALACVYGFRQGELLALRWDDVNVAKGEEPTVRVSVTIKWPNGGGWYLDEPKTPGSVRVVELDPGIAALMRQHRKLQAEARLAAGEAWTEHGFVFTTDTGAPIQDRNCLRWWYGRLDACGLDRRPFHATRRTAITNMAERGVPLEVAAAIVGHASIRMTAEVYNRVRPRGRRDAAVILGGILGGD